jgi:hypothetical protein
MTHTYTQVVEKSQGESRIRQQTHKAEIPAAISLEDRHDRVANAAYLRSEHRGFLPGAQLQDWLDAEAEVDELLTQVS